MTDWLIYQSLTKRLKNDEILQKVAFEPNVFDSMLFSKFWARIVWKLPKGTEYCTHGVKQTVSGRTLNFSMQLQIWQTKLWKKNVFEKLNIDNMLMDGPRKLNVYV